MSGLYSGRAITMFPPMTSSLSLDAYLLRFAKPNTLKFWRRKRSTPEICELRKYRRNIKRFLTTLVSEVLRERLRQAAEHDGKTITGFLEDHQWAVLRATGNNQLIIDLIYPRVSDSLDISKWGPLLTCLILKAVKCLTADEIANVNIIDKLCRKYITRNRRITRKRLPKVKEDWNTICTCSQKMADNAKSAKLIKAVRNFIIDVSLQPASTTKRPYSAPALTNSKADNANLPMVRRPATTTLSRDKVSLNSSRDRPVTFDFTKQRQSNYRAPTLLMIPEAFGGNPEPYKNYDSLSHDHNKSMKKISVEDCEIEAADDSAKSVTRHFWKKTQSSDRSSLLAEENRLRRFSGRSRTPVPIPRTIADIKPAKRPYRLMPLKFHVGNVASGRTFVPSVQATQVEKRTLQHHQHFKKEQNERHRLYSPGYKTPTPRPEASPRDDTSNNSSTPRKDFTKKTIKHLIKETVKHRHIEHVANEPLFRDKGFIDAFFNYLEKTNKTVKFLHSKNTEPQSNFETAGGSKVCFSFLHYCLCKFINDKDDEESQVLLYLVKRLLDCLICDHNIGDDVIMTCWKCNQKDLAMDISVKLGNTTVCKLLLDKGVPYREKHLAAAVRAEATDLVEQIVNYLKENDSWDPNSQTLKITLKLARANKMKYIVALLESEGVDNETELTTVTCLSCFTRNR